MQIVLRLKHKISVKDTEQIAYLSVKRTIKQDAVLSQVLSKECHVSIYVKVEQSICECCAIQPQIKAFKTLYPASTVMSHTTFQIHGVPKACNMHGFLW